MNGSNVTSTDLDRFKPAAWHLYWEDVQYSPGDHRANLVREIVAFFQRPEGNTRLEAARSLHDIISLPLDFEGTVQASGIEELKEAVYHAPSDALACIGAAAYEALFVREGIEGVPRGRVEGPAKVMIRLHNHPSSFVSVSSIRADQVNRLVTFRGTVCRSTGVRPLVTAMQFVCARCGGAKDVVFPDGRYALPASCGENGCRSRTLTPNRGVTRCVDWQRIQLQGLPCDEKHSHGRVPRPMDVELSRDLVRTCSPGDVVTITGIVKALPGEPASGKRFGNAKRQCLFLPYVEAVSVTKSGGDAVDGGRSEQLEVVAKPLGISYLPPNMSGFTRLDIEFIRAFTSQCRGDQFRQLVRSFAPGICGMDIVKAGIVLSLFGGVRKADASSRLDATDAPNTLSTTDVSGHHVPIRGDIHVLLVGDPGLGKSQLLQSAAAVAPRGIYVCGSSASSAGLTVSVTRDNGEFSFDAGAVVLADRGLCCVDEFDKALSEHVSLLGVMEQQEVAVAKAGAIAALPARTSILAAANPIDGHYNKAKTLSSNLNMTPAMVSRFDLVFVLLDTSDAERDRRLARAVMSAANGLRSAGAREGPHDRGMYGNGFDGGDAASPRLLLGDQENAIAKGREKSSSFPSERLPLRDRLRQRRADDEALPKQLMRKYIAYARQYVHPTLSDEACRVIKSYYLELRERYAGDSTHGSLPVTARRLESLIRMAEARARLELREVVIAEDAEDAVDIMKEMLANIGGEGVGVLDFCSASENGLPRSLRGPGHLGKRAAFQSERRRYMDALHRHCDTKGDREVDAGELYTIADKIELCMPDTGLFLEQLNEAGDILKKGGGRYAINRPLRG